MGPKRGKRKNNAKEDDELEFEGKLKSTKSKWQLALEEQENEGDPQQLYLKQNKQIFEFDFSDEKYLLKQKEPVHVHREIYTDEQKQQLESMREKAKVDRQQKAKIKNEKKRERKKEQEILKSEERLQKEKLEQENKRVEREIQWNKAKSNPYIIPVTLFVCIALMVILQYHEEIHSKLAKFRNDEIDYYQVLEIDSGATDKEIKSKYKKLVLKYHPDRNPNCEDCKQKFDEIMQAWEVLGNTDKRASYDANSGVISEIKSSAVTLTPNNYQYLVQESQKIWLIQIYDSTDSYARYFNEIWEQVIREYGDVVQFGRIDIWHQKNMLSYIPYRFAVFPGLYILEQGYSSICSFNHERALASTRKCIDEHIQNIQVKFINEAEIEATANENKLSNGRLTAVMPHNMRNIGRIKAINQMFKDYVDFYFLDEKNAEYDRKVRIFGHSKTAEFVFKDNSKTRYLQYYKFVQTNFVQKVSLCQFLNLCEEQQCILVVAPAHKISNISDQLPFASNQNHLPVFALANAHESKLIDDELRRIQSEEGVFESFEIVVYEGGKIELGYTYEIGHLQPSEGQFINLKCRIEGWAAWIQRKGSELLGGLMDSF